ncbi:DUF1488 family protein [Tanticharoenia sakaeratensis]|nr:DUF1488 family protein [Tanticharoenia sakaeratensis]GBQ21422.1 hypothetical protein AA103193_1723 [Tanticharoenia sakaeratensis NBRC 103193]
MEESIMTECNEGSIGFEVQDGIRRVRCFVSREALEGAAGLALPSTPSSRQLSFNRFRMLINSAAKAKLARNPLKTGDHLTLECEDLRVMPAEAGVPLFGTQKTHYTPATPRQL